MTQAQNAEPADRSAPMAGLPNANWRRTISWLLVFIFSWWLVRIFLTGGATQEVSYSTLTVTKC